MKLFYFISFTIFSLLLFQSCKNEKVEPEIWTKFKGRLFYTTYSEIISLDANQRRVDTILRRNSIYTVAPYGITIDKKTKKIVYSYVNYNSWNCGLKTINFDGSGATELLLPFGTFKGFPTVSTDGQIIYWYGNSTPYSREEIWLGDEVLFTKSDLGAEPFPSRLAWSTDKNTIIFSRRGTTFGGLFCLYKLDLITKEVSLFLKPEDIFGNNYNNTFFHNPIFSSDGEKILFERHYSGGNTICIINKDKSGFKEIAQGSFGRSPVGHRMIKKLLTPTEIAFLSLMLMGKIENLSSKEIFNRYFGQSDSIIT